MFNDISFKLLGIGFGIGNEALFFAENGFQVDYVERLETARPYAIRGRYLEGISHLCY
jgi:hypothetical protein